MKVLHLPTSVGGNSWGLAQVEKALGLDSKVLIDMNNLLGYEADYILFSQSDSKFYKLLKRFIAFLSIRNKYDVYHFNFVATLLDFPKYNLYLIDLPYYKAKKVITYNGCDARQKYPTIKRVDFSACHFKDCYNGLCNSGKQDEIRRKKIEKVSNYVDHIFALNPDLMYFLPPNKTSFLPYTIAIWNKIKSEQFFIDKKIIIVHATTNRVIKGTAFILEA